VSIGSLYQYFPGKDALMAALIRLDTKSLAQTMRSIIDDADCLPLHDGISRLINAALDHQLARPTLARVIDAEEARLSMVEDITAANHAFRDMIAQFLAPHFEAMSQLQRTIAAQDCLAITRGMIDAQVASGALDRVQLHERLMRAVMGYLGGHLSAP
jgi:AcrR family transcriptional regulator